MTDTTLRFRSLFVSDVHLGSAGCMVDEFTRFLMAIDCDYVYLVGDIIDFWVAMKEGKWQQSHTNAMQTILNKTKENCQVFYTPGNHDAVLRRINNAKFGNLSIAHWFEHKTADGRRLQIVHGDLFDNSVRFVPIAWLAAWGYEGLTVINNKWNAKRSVKGKKSVEFSSVFKKRLKRFIGRRTDFIDILTEQAVSQGFDGVVCGHIHKPQILEQEGEGLYVNTGDWVEHGTAVVEYDDGRLELLTWRDIQHLLDPDLRLPMPEPRRSKHGGFVECAPSSLKH